MTPSVNSLTSIRQNVAEPATPTGLNTIDQTGFLKLLTTQLLNQDPTKPLDNAEFVSQLAQMSAVSGIDKLNATMAEVATRLGGDRVATASALIGRSVLVPGAVAAPDADGRIAGVVDLASPAERVRVTIADSFGRAVKTLELGAQAKGEVPFTWDGLDDSGARVAGDRFTIAAEATARGRTTPAPTAVVGLVAGVTPGAAALSPTLSVTGPGPVDLAQIRRIGA